MDKVQDKSFIKIKKEKNNDKEEIKEDKDSDKDFVNPMVINNINDQYYIDNINFYEDSQSVQDFRKDINY